MRILFLGILCFYLFPFTGLAQKKVEIQVYDAKTMEGLAFANLFLAKNEIGSATDEKGLASLSLRENFVEKDTLYCSFIGYKDTALVVDLSQISRLEISLKFDFVLLGAITVKGISSKITGKEIVRKAIKKIKNNYPNKAKQVNGFYRELIAADQQYIQINEAFFQLFYTGYPQKGYTGKSHRKYWKNRFRSNVRGSNYALFRNAQFFRYHNTIKDQCKIVEARISDNPSKEKIMPIAGGGPLGLTSADKVKYLADFLDPKLLSDYMYTKIGTAPLDNRLCYIINFKPINLKKVLTAPWNKKMRYPIFSGTLYIHIEDFAIVKFECQFAEIARTERYANRQSWQIFPTINKVIARYENGKEFWYLKSLKTEQIIKAFTRSKKWLKKDYRCIRELIITKISLEKAKPFASTDPKLLQDVWMANLREFPIRYNAIFWNDIDKNLIKFNEKSINLIR